MRPIGQRARGVAACLVVLSLLAPGSLGARPGCGVCPSDCPMHRAVDDAGSADLPCHRATQASSDRADALVLRAVCGRADAGDLVIQLRHRPEPVMEEPARAVFQIAASPGPAPAEPAFDVPRRPPRDVRSA